MSHQQLGGLHPGHPRVPQQGQQVLHVVAVLGGDDSLLLQPGQHRLHVRDRAAQHPATERDMETVSDREVSLVIEAMRQSV